MRYFDDAAVVDALPTEDAIRLVEQSFRWLDSGEAINAPRRRSHAGRAELNVMWSLVPPVGLIGVKSYTVVRSDVSRGAEISLLLTDIDTGQLVAFVKADALGQIRTGAATAVAAGALARPESDVLALFGAGFQAESQLRSVAHVLGGLREVRVVGRDSARRDAFIHKMSAELGVYCVAADAQSAVIGADIIVTATGSTEPLFDGNLVSAGTFVAAVGSNAATKRELDGALLARASRIVVDDREVASFECGDLILTGIDPMEQSTLGEVLNRGAAKCAADEIVVFESQGLAVQDVVCAAQVLERGVEVPLR
jgi:alanine dehydrogenase